VSRKTAKPKEALVLGIGCARHTPADLIARGVSKVLADNGLSLDDVREIASIDRKSDEAGLLALSESRGWPLTFFTAEELDSELDPSALTDVVHKNVGAHGVAEPAARLLAGTHDLLVGKTVYTEEGAGRSMTIAVARRSTKG
jgi:cobalt-precorrin 5A hydrolase